MLVQSLSDNENPLPPWDSKLPRAFFLRQCSADSSIGDSRLVSDATTGTPATGRLANRRMMCLGNGQSPYHGSPRSIPIGFAMGRAIDGVDGSTLIWRRTAAVGRSDPVNAGPDPVIMDVQ